MEEKLQISNSEIRKTIQVMVLPIVIESILQMTAGFCLTAMMGRLDPISISAFSLSNRIINIIWAILRGITMGSAVFVAQAYGSRNTDKIKHNIKQTILGIIVGFITQEFIGSIIMGVGCAIVSLNLSNYRRFRRINGNRVKNE